MCKSILCFPGELCDVDINECDEDPCLHGECENMEGSFGCDCDPGFEGNF